MSTPIELLIVQNNPIHQSIYIDRLSAIPCHLSFCNQIEQTLALTELIQPDAIILDDSLCERKPEEALQLLRTALTDQGKDPNLCLIIATSSRRPLDHKRLLSAGASNVLVKPLSKEQLHRLLDPLINAD